jgi:hypothetical protein
VTERTEPEARPTEPQPTDPATEAVLDEVLRAIRSIEFGSVLIKIHQGEVVGIETSTKLRLKNAHPTT